MCAVCSYLFSCITISMQADISENGASWYLPSCVPFCSRSNVRTNGWPDFTRNRSVSFWRHCSHWQFVQYRICTPQPLRLAFFFWLPCSIPLVTCCQNGKMKKPRNNGVRIPEHCPNTTIDIITQCCHE